MEVMSKKSKYRKENKRLKTELSQAYWLLYESCKEENENCTNGIFTSKRYFTDNIGEYGIPWITKIYDGYYDGYWMKCSWEGHDDWIWLYEKSDEMLTNMYWWVTEDYSSRSEEYIWDDYYNGWWIFSECDKINNLEWVWWG